MRTEGVELSFEPAALREIARVAVETNTYVDNLGARRLHSVIESIMEEISFGASTQPTGTKISITKEVVQERLKDLKATKDMSKHIL